ncbi:hypothetical protein NLU13_4032 [Sarocladium strictum]|uniref:NodB homology domain-containing protein n=1 Tax=Sarocladium strictum TaxID=5046 RepID=A0AA39GI46_SARSR|nr:hypothetical protein NLU13_4032 [Sarocladium strictum]
MRFTSALCAVSALLLNANATPIDLDKRQTAPAPVPPYVAQGVAIYTCTKPNTIALTFDDGITGLADQVVTALNNAGMKGTFFVNGENWGILRDHKATLQNMINSGHQVGSHTWSHPYLTKLSEAEVRDQMTRLENEFLSLVGRYPTYMRPPYFDINNVVLDVMKSLKYRVIITDLDTKDYEKNLPASLANFRTGLDQKKSIVLAHDVHDTTVNTLVPQMIAELKSRNMKSVTVGECLGEHPNNWYRYKPR